MTPVRPPGRTIGRRTARRPGSLVILLVALALSAAALNLSACGGGGDSTSSAGQGRVQLVYQDWRTEWFPPMAQKEFQLFQAQHPDLSVFYTPDPENLIDQMPLDMQAGNAADVFQGCCGFFPAWAQKGYVLDLSKYVESDLDKSIVADWDPAQYKAMFDASGRQFGLPKYQGTLVLYYNKDIFDKYGVPYPDASWDQDDYLAAMKKLTRDTNGDGKTDIWGSMIDIGWDRLQVHVNAWGGHIVDPADPTKCDIDDPRGPGGSRVGAGPDVGRQGHGDVHRRQQRGDGGGVLRAASSRWSRTAPGLSRTSWRTRTSASAWRPSPRGRRGGRRSARPTASASTRARGTREEAWELSSSS